MGQVKKRINYNYIYRICNNKKDCYRLSIDCTISRPYLHFTAWGKYKFGEGSPYTTLLLTILLPDYGVCEDEHVHCS